MTTSASAMLGTGLYKYWQFHHDCNIPAPIQIVQAFVPLHLAIRLLKKGIVKNQNFLSNILRERKDQKPDVSQRNNLSLEKLAGETRAQAMMGRLHLDQDYLVMDILLVICLSLNLMSRPQRWTSGPLGIFVPFLIQQH